jgi:hypothetical protein
MSLPFSKKRLPGLLRCTMRLNKEPREMGEGLLKAAYR